MVRLTLIVEDVSNVMLVYDQIQVASSTTMTPADLTNYTVLSGVSGHPVDLVGGTTQYSLVDPSGDANTWYISRYMNTATSSYSGWSDPVLGETGDIFYNPLYPAEISYGTSDQRIIDKIRRLIGDPVGLYRDYGEEAKPNIHSDNKTYELTEKGWPAAITIDNEQKNDSTDPTVNGYRYLRFTEEIDDTTTISGVEYGVDIWYYTFRHSDREIMEAYDNAFTPAGLTPSTTPATVYMIQTAIDLLSGELWEDLTEDGAKIGDDETRYDPSPGLDNRRRLLDNLRKRLDDLIRQYKLTGIQGVLID